jgi:hypothetical protein
MLVLAFLTSLTQALAAQLFPLFLVLCSLGSAIAVSASTEEDARLQELEATVRKLQDAEDSGEDDESVNSHSIAVAEG